MKIKIQIKSIFGKVLFELEKENNTIAETVIKAVESYADLRYADLRSADLRYANLRYAYGLLVNSLTIQQTRILPEGDIIGYKKAYSKEGKPIVVKLLIPKEAKRSHAFGRKCRAEYAKVLEITGRNKKAYSNYDRKVIYETGKTIKPDSFDNDWREECSSGIHFFITKVEAENY